MLRYSASRCLIAVVLACRMERAICAIAVFDGLLLWVVVEAALRRMLCELADVWVLTGQCGECCCIIVSGVECSRLLQSSSMSNWFAGP